MSSPGFHTITDEERQEFASFANANERISNQVPATLPCGFVVDTFHAECARCKQDIPMHSSWLKRTRQEFGSSVIETWDVRAYCSGCCTLTKTYARYRSNGSFDTLIGHTWRSGSLNAEDSRSAPSFSSLIRRIMRWIFGLL